MSAPKYIGFRAVRYLFLGVHQLLYSVCDNSFLCRCLSLLLALSSRVYLFFPPRGHEPPPTQLTVSAQTSASSAVPFQFPAMPNARMSLCTQPAHYFSFPPRPLRYARSRFPNTPRFGSRPSLIRMSAYIYKILGKKRHNIPRNKKNKHNKRGPGH